MTLKWEYLVGDAREVLKTLPEKSVQMCVTSPPYFGLRDEGIEGQIGLEKTLELYVQHLIEIFQEVRRVLRDDGTLWLNLGDNYAGSGKGGNTGNKISKNWRPVYVNKGLTPPGLKPKDLMGMPWRVALALQADGWWLRSDIIWHKPNPMPESATDRPTRSHEYIFLLTKSAKYYYNNVAIREKSTLQNGLAANFKRKTKEAKVPGQQFKVDNGTRNKRTVWKITAQKCSEAHFAIFPEALIEPCVLAGSKEKDIVLDPFAGSGTTLAVSRKLGRSAIGIDINPKYEKLAKDRAKLRVRDINSFGGGPE